MFEQKPVIFSELLGLSCLVPLGSRLPLFATTAPSMQFGMEAAAVFRLADGDMKAVAGLKVACGF